MTASSFPVPVRPPRILPGDLESGTLSVVVFGPGEGEAILVFFPDGSVGVVDGCREPERGNAEGRGDPVRELLAEYEKSHPGFRIRFVCLTHPHDDHYAGLGRLMVAYSGRIDAAWGTFSVAGRYQRMLPEYVRKIRARPGAVPDDESEVKGLQRVFEAFHQFRSVQGPSYDTVERNKILFEGEMIGHPVVVVGWAAHPADIESAVEDLSLAVEAAAIGGTFPSHDPNRVSGALSITWGKAGVLLAGDALRGESGKHVGWAGAHHLARKHPIQVVSVAHHASEGAHDETLWSLLAPQVAIVTPFRHAEGPMPPRPEQIARLASSCTVAMTSPPSWPRSKKNPKPITTGRSRKLTSKIGLCPAAPNAARHAVAVSLDPEGKLMKLILAEGADIYL